ncbi:MAG: ACT domain-containing protein [Clostridia bacterium]|nr:ACT domain-containing protein [Clostridia bacterium]MBQ7048786.1 ACT domain-containing protein [Clostridia bacterium]
MLITQISVYLENIKGTLRSLTKTLAENNIDMLALSIADTTNFGIVRIVVRENDIDSAIKALRDNGFVAKTNHVIGIAVPNQPAGLDKALAVIEENNVSIEYMYSLNYIIGNNALMVLRLNAQDMTKDEIAKMLRDNEITTISQEDVNKL